VTADEYGCGGGGRPPKKADNDGDRATGIGTGASGGRATRRTREVLAASAGGDDGRGDDGSAVVGLGRRAVEPLEGRALVTAGRRADVSLGGRTPGAPGSGGRMLTGGSDKRWGGATRAEWGRQG